MKQRLKHLGFGLLGAVIFLGVSIGVAAFGHSVHLPPLLTNVLLAAAGFATYLLYVRGTEHRKVTELQLRAAPAPTVAGFALGIGLFAVVIALLAAGGHYRIISVDDPFALVRGLIPCFSGAIVEELLFRGFIFRVLRDIAGTWIAVAVSAILFGALHAVNPGATLFSSVAVALEAGVLLAIAYAATNRLWLPIGIHAGWNYAEGTIFGTAVSGTNIKDTLFHGMLAGDPLWTGGAFGVEASVVAIAVCILAAVVLAIKVKRGRLVEATV